MQKKTTQAITCLDSVPLEVRPARTATALCFLGARRVLRRLICTQRSNSSACRTIRLPRRSTREPARAHGTWVPRPAVDRLALGLTWCLVSAGKEFRCCHDAMGPLPGPGTAWPWCLHHGPAHALAWPRIASGHDALPGTAGTYRHTAPEEWIHSSGAINEPGLRSTRSGYSSTVGLIPDPDP